MQRPPKRFRGAVSVSILDDSPRKDPLPTYIVQDDCEYSDVFVPATARDNNFDFTQFLMECDGDGEQVPEIDDAHHDLQPSYDELNLDHIAETVEVFCTAEV